MPEFPIDKKVVDEAKARILTSKQYIETPFVTGGKRRSYRFSVSGNGKEIYFFGTKHLYDPSDGLFDEIQKAFDAFKPDKVYVEGVAQSRFHLYEKGLEDAQLSDLKQRGEPAFVGKLVLEERKNRPMGLESPEISEADESKQLVEKGFTHKEIFQYRFYALVSQYQRRHAKDDGSCDKVDFELFISRMQSGITAQAIGCSEEEVLSFKKEEVDNVQLENKEKYRYMVDPIPWENRPRTRINELSEASGRIRDEYIVERLAEGLKNHDRLFIVYGFTHAVVDEPALEYLMAHV